MDYFELSMDTNSVHKWEVEDALRDLVQNWADNENGGGWGYDPLTEELKLTNYYTQLSRKVFLHGYSEKQEDKSSRGCHGDGLKSSIAVLLREGLGVMFENGKLLWKPSVRYSDTFQEDVVCITEEDFQEGSEDYTVRITGVSGEVMAKVIKNTLQFQDDTGDKHETPLGDILLDEVHKGRVYCGGLFVSNFKSDYGFDFKPEHFPLDRDRKSANPFEVKWQCKEMWGYVSKEDTPEIADQLIGGLKSNEHSMEFVSYTLEKTNSLKTAAEKVYNEEYSGKLVTSDYDEFKELQADGNDVELVKSEGLVNLIKSTSDYKVVFEGRKFKKKPAELLEDFKQQWYDDFTTDMLYAFEDMQQQIDN